MKRTVSFSKNAANLFLHILTRCNLACRHCYINPRQHGRGRLSLETIETWLTALRNATPRTNVVFLGGEPTLHPDLPQAAQTARALGYASITIDTNGYLFHDILERVTPETVDVFSFSLDGATAATNDALRGNGSYAVCTEGIRRTKRRGFGTSLIYTVSGANLHELERMPALLRDLGLDRFFIQVIGLRGKSAGSGATTPQVPREAWLEIVPAVAARVAAAGIPVTYPRVFLAPHETFECAGLVADNYFVFPNGRVYRCPLCEDHPLHSLRFEDGSLIATGGINEAALFGLQIPEGCVMNKLIQPGNLEYGADGTPAYRIACCLLKEEVLP